MSIRTTVTLDDDVVERVRHESRSRGMSFRETLNDLLRHALMSQSRPPERRHFKVKATAVGLRAGLTYDDVEALLEYGEGQSHR